MLYGFDFPDTQFWKQCYSTEATTAGTCEMEKLFLGKLHFAAKQRVKLGHQSHLTVLSSLTYQVRLSLLLAVVSLSRKSKLKLTLALL